MSGQAEEGRSLKRFPLMGLPLPTPHGEPEPHFDTLWSLRLQNCRLAILQSLKLQSRRYLQDLTTSDFQVVAIRNTCTSELPSWCYVPYFRASDLQVAAICNTSGPLTSKLLLFAILQSLRLQGVSYLQHFRGRYLQLFSVPDFQVVAITMLHSFRLSSCCCLQYFRSFDF